MTSIISIASAKINLSLSITGKRADGYHLLDSYVSFADWGDEVSVAVSGLHEEIQLNITGEFADGCGVVEKNLAYRAAELVLAAFPNVAPRGVELHIKKNIPIGAGLGGGSSDAAAVMKSLNSLLGLNIPVAQLAEMALPLGADVPACLYAQPLRMQGIGEEITLMPSHPKIPAILLNPRTPLATANVYEGLNVPASQVEEEGGGDVAESRDDLEAYIRKLEALPQDLQSPAISIMPEISDILSLLSMLEGCKLSRICGSGATCMGLFADIKKRDAALNQVQTQHPALWFQPVMIG